MSEINPNSPATPLTYHGRVAHFIAVNKRRLLGVLVAIVLIGGSLAGLWVTNVFGWRVWRIQEAQTFIGAPLPEGAADIQFTTRTQYGRIIWIRFSLPTNTDLTPFLTQMGIRSTIKDGVTPFPKANPQEAGITWWQPTVSRQFSGLYWNDGAKIIEVLSNFDDSVKTVIYLRAYALG